VIIDVADAATVSAFGSVVTVIVRVTFPAFLSPPFTALAPSAGTIVITYVPAFAPAARPEALAAR
jgi:hypothetical protein